MPITLLPIQLGVIAATRSMGLPTAVSGSSGLSLVVFTGIAVWALMLWLRERGGRRRAQADSRTLSTERDYLLETIRISRTEQDAIAATLRKQHEKTDLLRSRGRTLEEILAVSARINATRNRGELSDKIVQAVSEILDFKRVVLYLWSDATHSFEPRGFAGVDADEVAALVEVQLLPAEYAELTHPRHRYSNCYLVPAPLNDPGRTVTFPGPAGDPAARWQKGQRLVAPLIASTGENFGFVCLEDPGQRRVPDLVEVRQLEFLVQQAATALESADVYDRLAHNNAELSVASDKLNSLAEMKRNFVANVSHELRTPLTSISAYSELLQQNMESLSGEALSEFLKVIHGESVKLSDIINDILELSNMEQSPPALDQKRTDLNSLLQHLVESWQSRARERNIEFKVESRLEDGILVADGLLIQQMLAHLVGNAFKFTPDGGRVWIRTSENGTAVRLTVEDTGIGIPPDKLGEIFDRFYQVDSSSTREHNGQGVGLAICHDIVTHHDGRIWAENREPCGTRFSVLLPRRPQVVQPTDPGSLSGLPFEAGEFMQRLMHWISESLGIRMATLMVPDTEGESLVIRAAIGLPETVVQSARVRKGTGFVGHVWEKRSTLLVADVTAESDRSRDVSEPRYTTPSLLCVPLLEGEELVGVITVNNRDDGRPLDDDDRLFLESLAPRVTRLLVRYTDWQNHAREFQAIRRTLRDTTAVGHQRHESLVDVCQEICLAVARKIRLADDELEHLAFALQFYDVGLGSIPPQLLNKPNLLDEAEVSLVRQHVQAGLDILAPLDPDPRVRQIILHHHENFDGSGYPMGLAGEAIPLGARLVRLTDTLTAMLSRRPWRGAFTLDQTVAEIRSEAGRRFCPRMTDVLLDEVEARRERILGLQHDAVDGQELNRPVLDKRGMISAR